MSKLVMITVRCHPLLHIELKELAARKDQSLNKFCVAVLTVACQAGRPPVETDEGYKYRSILETDR